MKSSLYRNYATDTQKEIQGVEVKFDANDDETIPTFVISRMGESNKEYTKALERATAPYKRQIQMKTMSADLSKSLFLEVFATTVLRGWSNVYDENGNAIGFSKENAVKILTDLPDLYNELLTQAGDAALFRKDSLEQDAKN